MAIVTIKSRWTSCLEDFGVKIHHVIQVTGEKRANQSGRIPLLPLWNHNEILTKFRKKFKGELSTTYDNDTSTNPTKWLPVCISQSRCNSWRLEEEPIVASVVVDRSGDFRQQGETVSTQLLWTELLTIYQLQQRNTSRFWRSVCSPSNLARSKAKPIEKWY